MLPFEALAWQQHLLLDAGYPPLARTDSESFAFRGLPVRYIFSQCYLPRE